MCNITLLKSTYKCKLCSGVADLNGKSGLQPEYIANLCIFCCCSTHISGVKFLSVLTRDFSLVTLNDFTDKQGTNWFYLMDNIENILLIYCKRF